jgi:hypothetical protein
MQGWRSGASGSVSSPRVSTRRNALTLFMTHLLKDLFHARF